jgi:probable O-glycosylation ligase (exosortase A-associated)
VSGVASGRARAQQIAAPAAASALTLAFVALAYFRPQDWIGPLAKAPLATLLAAPLALVLVARAQPSRLRQPELGLLGLIAAFAMVWVPFATNRYWAFESFKFYAVEALSAAAICAFIDSGARLRTLFIVLLAAFGAQAVFAIGHGGRGFATYTADENDLALGMNMALPLAVAGAVSARRAVQRLVFLALAGLFVAAVIASESRGGFVGLAATCGAMLLLSRRRGIVLALLLVGAVVLAALAPAEYWGEMETILDPTDPTRLERIRHWNLATAAWRDNPIFGVGPGNIPWVVERYEVYDTQLTRSLAGRAVHSLFFTLLAEYGIVGIALFGSLIGLVVRRCWRLARSVASNELDTAPWARAILASIAAWLSSGVFLSVLDYPQFYCLVGVAIALSQVHAQRGAEPVLEAAPAWAPPLRPAHP